MQKPEKIDPRAKLATFDAAWTPKIVASLNGQHVKVAHFEGEYVWHSHAEEDELFMVLEGRVDIALREGVVELSPGEMCVVPRGVEHKPVARERAQVLLFEPATTRNTGDREHRHTIEPDDLEWI